MEGLPSLPTAPAAAQGAAQGAAHDAEAIDEAEAVHDALRATIPPLPPSPGFATYEEVYDFVQGFLRDNGAAVIKRSSSHKRDINGISLATRIDLMCDRGPQRASVSAGLRKTST